jgi:hypothetical protein
MSLRRKLGRLIRSRPVRNCIVCNVSIFDVIDMHDVPFCVRCVGTDWFGTAHFDIQHPNSSDSEQESGWRAHIVVKSHFFQPPL